jgi:ribosomal protein S18 acetylase RimI-like enzyme
MLFQKSIENITPDMLTGFFEGWPHPPSTEKHLELSKSYRVIFAIDEISDRVAGFINAISDGVLTAYIPLLEVLPEYRNHGLGSQLVSKMLGELKHLYMIDLMCDDDLQEFYEKNGMFKASGMVFRNYDQQSGA